MNNSLKIKHKTNKCRHSIGILLLALTALTLAAASTLEAAQLRLVYSNDLRAKLNPCGS